MRVSSDWRRSDGTGPYTLHRCGACEFASVFPTPTPEALAKAYDVSYYTHELVSDGPGARLLDNLRFKIAARLDRGTPISMDWFVKRFGERRVSVCEIGCGDGALLVALSRAGYRVRGVEPDPNARSTAEGAALGIDVLVGTAEDLPAAIRDDRFDVVVLNHVLEHTADPISAIRNAGGLLAPGGLLVVETPNHTSIGFARAKETWAFLDVPRHLHFFTEASLKKVCESGGVSVAEVEYHGYCRQLEQAWVDTERAIWDALRPKDGARLPRRNSSLSAWTLLARTAFAESARKYDSVRIIARAS